MIGEIDLAGVFLSPLLLCLLAAFFARMALSWLLGLVGFYRMVWNRPLFDISLFFILLGAAFAFLRIATTS